MDREDASKSDEPGVLSTLTAFIARKGRRAWQLTVVDKVALAPRMIRVRFSGSDLDELAWKRGQDLVLEIPNGEDIARPAEFLIDSTGTAVWINLTENYWVRARPEQVFEVANRLEK